MSHMDSSGRTAGGRFRVDLPLVEALLRISDADEAELRDLPAALIAVTSAIDLASHHHKQGDHLLALLQRARILSRMRRLAQARDDLSAAGRLFEQAGIEGLSNYHEAASAEECKLVSPTRLTAAESRVEALVRYGQSNREIAAALFLSVRTVESHVSSILRKTGSASRSKLIAHIPYARSN